MSTQYRVSWETDAEAETPQQAAMQVAKAYFQKHIADGQSQSACVFRVRVSSLTADKPGQAVIVDLSTMSFGLGAEELRELYGMMGHPLFPTTTWRHEATHNMTLLGYWEWLVEKVENYRITGEQDDE